ncbi:MAG: carboxypeptidase-like regulatory domain-containing protein, partial [Bryobacteraceae bacterium]
MSQTLVRLSFGFALAAALSYGQQGRGTILGTVTDSSGAAVVGARVTVTNVDTNVSFGTVTNQEGYYTVPPLNVGHYSVSVEMQGFKRSVRSGVVIAVDQRARVDMALEVGALTESVQVVGVAPLVETSTGALGKVVENRRVQELPLNGRNALALTLLTPSVKS